MVGCIRKDIQTTYFIQSNVCWRELFGSSVSEALCGNICGGYYSRPWRNYTAYVFQETFRGVFPGAIFARDANRICSKTGTWEPSRGLLTSFRFDAAKGFFFRCRKCWLCWSLFQWRLGKMWLDCKHLVFIFEFSCGRQRLLFLYDFWWQRS